MGDRKLVKKVSVLDAGRIVRYKAGDVVPAEVVARNRMAEHLFEPSDDADPRSKFVESLTVAQLRAYADEAGVDLTGARTKADIIHAIQAHHAAEDEADKTPDETPGSRDAGGGAADQNGQGAESPEPAATGQGGDQTETPGDAAEQQGDAQPGEPEATG